MVILVGNEISNQNSNLAWTCLHLLSCKYPYIYIYIYIYIYMHIVTLWREDIKLAKWKKTCMLKKKGRSKRKERKKKANKKEKNKGLEGREEKVKKYSGKKRGKSHRHKVYCYCSDIEVIRFCYGNSLSEFLRLSLIVFIIKGFQTIVFIFIVISTTFQLICPLGFFRCLSNSRTNMEFQTTSFIKSTGVTCSDSVKIYKGETGSPLKVRQGEYWKAVVRGEIEKSGMVDHIWKEKGNHLSLWDEVEIIDREHHLIMLSVKQGGIKCVFFESLVWLDLGLNPSLPDHWQKDDIKSINYLITFLWSSFFMIFYFLT